MNNFQLSRSGRSSWASARARPCEERGVARPRAGDAGPAGGEGRRERPCARPAGSAPGEGWAGLAQGCGGRGGKQGYGRRSKQRTPGPITPLSTLFGVCLGFF